MNPILKTDSYKFSHFKQYPPGTTEVSAYIEARPGGRFSDVTFFGLQMFLKGLQPITMADVDEAEAVITAHGEPFCRDGFELIVNEHGGHWPVEIEALPEGMTVPAGTPLVQIRNTDPRLPWITTFIETQLLRAVWYPSTVATLSRHAKQVIYNGLLRSSDDPDAQIPFKLHDFGARGCTSGEQAGIGGLAHLVNFMGTDTVEALVYARRFYGAEMAGFSIPAAEHSTIVSWGRDREADAYENMLVQFGGPGKLVAVVSDSYDIIGAVRNIWGDKLKHMVCGMEGTLVVRPDSGDPVETPVQVLRELETVFGATRNSKGYRVLNPAVRVIQGDGMNIDSIGSLVRRVMDAGFSIDNIAFGMGGGLLQKVDRDTLRFAMKANEVIINGERRSISKTPVTDPTKASKAGRQTVMGPDGNLLQRVWSNGILLRETTLDAVRLRAALTADPLAQAA
jgi:nicotinamide phosphoribosyltransferase